MNEPNRKAPTNDETPFQRFERLLKNLVSVPKKAIEAEEARWRANRPSKKKSSDG